MLYISWYLEQHRREYYERLQAVREKAEIQEWLQFFLTAVAVQAEDGILRAERLNDLRQSYRTELAGSRSRAVEVVDLAFSNPFLATRLVEAALGVTNQGALNLIRQLEKRGWVQQIGTTGRGGRTLWVAEEVYAAVSEPPAATTPGPEQLTVSAWR